MSRDAIVLRLWMEVYESLGPFAGFWGFADVLEERLEARDA